MSNKKQNKQIVDLMKQDKVLRILGQTGQWYSKKRDKQRVAKLAGKRISKTGKIYWETRKNRSDAPLKAI